MFTKLEKLMLFLTVLALPFAVLPHNYIISSIGKNLSEYTLLVGIFLWMLESIKYKRVDINRKYLMYIGIYILWRVLTTGIGLINYDYYDMISLSQMDKLSAILGELSNAGLVIPESIAIKFWLFARFTKDVIKNTVICFGGAFLVMHLYKYSPSDGFKQIRKAVLLLVCIMSVYSVVEIGSLYGVLGANSIIAKISPYIMDVESSHGWWPPVLWKGQLRSLCPEPSYFGIIATFIVPVLFSFILEGKYLLINMLYIFFVLMIFLTKARTATVLFLGEMALIVLFTGTFMRYYWRRSLVILLCAGLAFGFSIKGVDIVCQEVTKLITNTNKVSNSSLIDEIKTEKLVKQANHYVDKNIKSIVGNSRSNVARKACVYAQIMVGIKHPIFGVGYGLGDAYINDEIPDWAYSNKEVRNWSRYMYNQGVLKSGFPPLNKFSAVLVSSGFIGLLLYIFPIGYVAYIVLKRKILKNNIPAICLFISFLGSLAAMFSNTEFVCFYIIIGLLLCYVESDAHI